MGRRRCGARNDLGEPITYGLPAQWHLYHDLDLLVLLRHTYVWQLDYQPDKVLQFAYYRPIGCFQDANDLSNFVDIWRTFPDFQTG